LKIEIVLVVSAMIMLTLVAGCASNPPPKKDASGVYTLFRQDLRGVFGDPDSFRAAVLMEADRIAEEQGGVVIPIAFKQTPVGSLAHWATIEYRFIVGSPADLKDRDKSVRTHAGDSREKVQDMFGDPTDRQFRGTQEAWTYVDMVGINDYKYTIIWFQSGLVTGITTYRNSGTAESGLRTINWEQAPDKVLEVRSR